MSKEIIKQKPEENPPINKEDHSSPTKKNTLPSMVPEKIQELCERQELEKLKIVKAGLGIATEAARAGRIIIESKSTIETIEKQKEFIAVEIEKIEALSKSTKDKSDSEQEKLNSWIQIYQKTIQEYIPTILTEIEGVNQQIKAQIILEMMKNIPEMKVSI